MTVALVDGRRRARQDTNAGTPPATPTPTTREHGEWGATVHQSVLPQAADENTSSARPRQPVRGAVLLEDRHGNRRR